MVMSALRVRELAAGTARPKAGQDRDGPVAAGSYEVTPTGRPCQASLPPGRRITFKATSTAGLYQGQTGRENPIIEHPCLYAITLSPYRTIKSQAHWTMHSCTALVGSGAR